MMNLARVLAAAVLASAALIVPATSAQAAPTTVVEPHCGEWVDYNSNENRRMKSWLCFYDSGDGGVYPVLWTECGWLALFGIGWEKPPNGCRIWEPSYYEITFPDGTKTRDKTFPGASGSNTANSTAETYPCQPGDWRIHSYYGVQMKDVLGNWGSSVSATHEVTVSVSCP
ncbi:hypothetical protein [Actinokineospora diospyrosa]|uniref:Peptidase inhibitor family I36 n=1 Tax=Actinokineospora diospyrosa TaxID=103728 RepID=A0ABT1III6_9PSEU|nr:hypothetical protein [Actinokineospora diospyrosa]MCP2272056.1 hypothetical protein [Actinokineospora diospyrosa]